MRFTPKFVAAAKHVAHALWEEPDENVLRRVIQNDGLIANRVSAPGDVSQPIIVGKSQRPHIIPTHNNILLRPD